MIRFWIRVIAVLEIIGGIFGVALIAWVLVASRFHPHVIILAPVYIAIDVMSFVAGVKLWRGRPGGRTASIIIQIIQLPKIVSPALVFMFSFGLDAFVHLLVGADFVHYGLEFRFLAVNQLGFYVPSAPVDFGVSITAWVFLVMLLKYKPGKAPETAIPTPPPAIELTEQI